MSVRFLVFAGISLSIPLVVALPCSAQVTVPPTNGLAAFLSKHCLECHDAASVSGDRQFDDLFPIKASADQLIRLQEIIDQLVLGSMPPAEHPAPTDAERLQAIALTRQLLASTDATIRESARSGLLRRLNRREYRNTVEQLLGIRLQTADPTIRFPADPISLGYDNIGAALSTSGFLLEEYLNAADTCIEKSVAAGQSTSPQTWHFADNFNQQPELAIAHRKAFNYRYMVLYDHPLNDKPEGAYGAVPGLPGGVPVDGVYRVRVLAEALNRDTPYGKDTVQIDCTEPFRMGVRPGDSRISDQVHIQPAQPLLAETVVLDRELKWYEFRVYLDKGYVPRLTFENGQHDVRGAYNRVFRNHRETLPENVRAAKGIVAMRNAVIDVGYLPQIRISEIEIHGPLKLENDADQSSTVIEETSLQDDTFPGFLSDFLHRAWRRPVKSDDTRSLLQLRGQFIQAGRTQRQASLDTLKAALCAPDFLFFKPASQETGLLDASGLAERLSYFLTSGMPDASLLAAAAQDELLDAEQLQVHAQRLLASPDFERFVADFLDGWLNLRDLGSMPPDPQAFRQYYSSGLEPEMKRETQFLFQEAVRNNLPISKLLSADFSFVNRDLAKLYGVTEQVPSEAAEQFHSVSLADAGRGGILGHASVLTVSANGIDTSPVTRGVYVLERILGIHQPPPPDDVPAIDPDVRGAGTIREVLQKHREDVACLQCHRVIDPPGFALESFDPIGRRRRFYDRKQQHAIDTSGRMPDGSEFTDESDLREILNRRADVFPRNVAVQLSTYALGRHPTPTDQLEISELLQQIADHNGQYPLQDLILAITRSKMFRKY